MPQDEINALLVRLARMGKRVVRLKGGDPFVFARGGEELAGAARGRHPCEAIPGVTAGIAVPAAADIPVTYRGEAVRLTFVTAHEGGSPQVRWDLLAQDQHATLVGYMGVSTLAEVSAALIAGGMSPATPAAVIEQGTLPGQRSVRAPLAELAAAAKANGIKPPAIFVIGQVVAHAETLQAPPKPLRGLRIALFAPAGELGLALEAAGASLLVAPEPLTAAARLVIGAGPLAGWLVRSSAELAALESARAAHGFAVRGTLWCLSSALVAEARQHGFPQVAETRRSRPRARSPHPGREHRDPRLAHLLCARRIGNPVRIPDIAAHAELPSVGDRLLRCCIRSRRSGRQGSATCSWPRSRSTLAGRPVPRGLPVPRCWRCSRRARRRRRR